MKWEAPVPSRARSLAYGPFSSLAEQVSRSGLLQVDSQNLGPGAQG